MGIHSVNGSPV